MDPLPGHGQALDQQAGNSTIEVGTRLAFPAGMPRRADLEEGQPETATFSYSNVGLKAKFESCWGRLECMS